MKGYFFAESGFGLTHDDEIVIDGKDSQGVLASFALDFGRSGGVADVRGAHAQDVTGGSKRQKGAG